MLYMLMYNGVCLSYSRPSDDVGGRRPFHSGVCCVVAAPDGNISQEDIECTASDELDNEIQILDDMEKPASSIVYMNSCRGLLKPEVDDYIAILVKRIFISLDI